MSFFQFSHKPAGMGHTYMALWLEAEFLSPSSKRERSETFFILNLGSYPVKFNQDKTY